VFKDATTYFSTDNKPSIANVIPTIDRINQMLAEDTSSNQLKISVKHALRLLANG
ncbi:hypothetical protein H0H92_012355, partial [Tricholoma furcatifolium]